MSTENSKTEQPCTLHSVSGSINVTNGCQPTQKQILLKSNWFNVDYYKVEDDGECLLITKCYLDIPKNAHKITKSRHISLITEMPNGKFDFDNDETTEDVVIIYYR